MQTSEFVRATLHPETMDAVRSLVPPHVHDLISDFFAAVRRPPVDSASPGRPSGRGARFPPQARRAILIVGAPGPARFAGGQLHLPPARREPLSLQRGRGLAVREPRVPGGRGRVLHADDLPARGVHAQPQAHDAARAAGVLELAAGGVQRCERVLPGARPDAAAAGRRAAAAGRVLHQHLVLARRLVRLRVLPLQDPRVRRHRVPAPAQAPRHLPALVPPHRDHAVLLARVRRLHALQPDRASRPCPSHARRHTVTSPPRVAARRGCTSPA